MKHKKPALNDGSEVLQLAQESNKKGVSRRDFLKLSGAAVAGWLLSSCVPEQLSDEQGPPTDISSSPKETTSSNENLQPIEEYLKPELVHGVEVYGLGEKITSEDQISRLYGHLDEKYASENNITIGNKVEQRKELLKPNERYLEVVVRQSAYESFIARQQETGVDFVEWIQMHVDTTNRCFENANPPVDLQSVLRRVVVIDEALPYDWDESAWLSGEKEALDVWYRNRFSERLPLDTDTSWAIATDYRVDTTSKDSQGYFWSYIHRDGKTVFGQPPGADQYERTYEFPDKNDSLSDHEKVWLDMGLTHEWLHYLFDGPDEYIFDAYPPYHFKQVYFATGSFQEPNLSPFLSYVLQQNLRDRQREYTYPEEAFILPSAIRLNVSDVNSTDVYIPTMPGNYYGEKQFPTDFTYSSGGENLELQNLINPNKHGFLPTNVYIKCRSESGTDQELCIPIAAFIMSKISGKDDPTFNVEFMNNSRYESSQTLITKLVDESKLDEHLQTNSQDVYAKMKVDGTNTWFVWSLA